MRPDISIVIPTFQRPALLARCLHALAHQHFPKNRYEIIIVTDGPDEITSNMVKQQGITTPAVHVYSLPVKKGPAAARNRGWQLAEGKLILFTDDDCIPHNYWIEAFYAAFIQQPDKAAAFTGQVLVPCSKKPTDYEKNIAWLEKADFVTANCACTKTALELIKGFDEAFTMAWREDSDLEFKLIDQGIPIRFVQQATVTHPVRKAGWGVSLKEQKKSMFNALLYKKYPGLYRRKIRKHPLWNYYAMAFLFIVAIIAAILQLKQIMFIALTGWVLLIAHFTIKRLTGTTHTFPHVIEMIVTSILIPFLSIYWTLYGSFKFKTLLL
jgi:GT2 family glycosyltransferase